MKGLRLGKDSLVEDKEAVASKDSGTGLQPAQLSPEQACVVMQTPLEPRSLQEGICGEKAGSESPEPDPHANCATLGWRHPTLQYTWGQPIVSSSSELGDFRLT